MTNPHVLNEQDVEFEEQAPDYEGFERKRLSRETGGEKLGCSLYRLAPGVRSWPYHYHTANEEALFVLGGRGTVRLGGDEVAIERGDYVTLPTGEEGAHRVCNSGDEELRYLCFSTMIEPEVSVYPDAEMVGVFAGAPPGGDEDDRTMKRFFDAAAETDYWENEG